MRILLLSEGNTDVTRAPDAVQGALRHILRLVLSELYQREVQLAEIAGDHLPRLHRPRGFQTKVLRAIQLADSDQDLDGIAIAIDRDGLANSNRRRLLEQGREDAQQHGCRLASRTAIGVMVEMLEAWLLADSQAISQVCSLHGAFSDPETYRDPKRELNALIGEHRLDVATTYDSIARRINLQVLRQRCPAFDDFYQEVRSRILSSANS